MTWESADDRRRRTRDRLVSFSVIATIAWSTLAFGGVYTWAYVPLLIAWSLIGVACLIPARGGLPRLANRAPLYLALAAVIVLLQLVPLPAGVLARISPSTDAFLKTAQFSYAVAASAPDSAAQLSHPLSLSPDSTWLGLAFLVALTLLLAGLMRWLTPSHVRTFVRGLIALGVIIAVVGVAQKSLGTHELREVKIYGFWKPLHFANPFGPFVNRNHFAGWIAMVLPLSLAYFAATLHEALSHVGPGLRNKILWLGSERAGQSITAGFAALVMAVAVVYSGSRSGLVCVLFGVVVIGWLAMRAGMHATTRMAIGGVFLLIAASALVWAGSDVILHRFTLVPAEIGERIGTWQDAWRVFRDFPLAGVGLNAYGTASLQYQTVASAWQYDAVHNDYLQIAAEGGVLLVVPALLAVIALVLQVRRRVAQHADDALVGWLRAGAIVGLAAIALQSLVEFSLQIPANAALFVALAAIAVHRPASLPTSRSSSRLIERETVTAG